MNYLLIAEKSEIITEIVSKIRRMLIHENIYTSKIFHTDQIIGQCQN